MSLFDKIQRMLARRSQRATDERYKDYGEIWPLPEYGFDPNTGVSNVTSDKLTDPVVIEVEVDDTETD